MASPAQAALDGHRGAEVASWDGTTYVAIGAGS